MQKTRHRKITLIPLMDIAFILLIFFLLNMFTLSGNQQETQLKTLIPKKSGSLQGMQAVIQIIDRKKAYWWDSDLVRVIDQGYKGPYSRLLKNKKYLMSLNECQRKLVSLIKKANNTPFRQYRILVRSPEKLPIEIPLKFLELAQLNRLGNVLLYILPGNLSEINRARFKRVQLPDKQQALEVRF